MQNDFIPSSSNVVQMDTEEYVESIVSEVDDCESNQIKYDFKLFNQYTNPEKAKAAVKSVKELSDDLEEIKREDIRSNFVNLIQYSVPVQDAKTSVRRRFNNMSSASSDSGNSYSSDTNNSPSDYELQKRDEYPENWDTLRKQAYERDEYRCQNCGVGGGPNGYVELHAHHVVPMSVGGNHNLTNLSTLCASCHSLIHEHMG